MCCGSTRRTCFQGHHSKVELGGVIACGGARAGAHLKEVNAIGVGTTNMPILLWGQWGRRCAVCCVRCAIAVLHDFVVWEEDAVEGDGTGCGGE